VSGTGQGAAVEAWSWLGPVADDLGRWAESATGGVSRWDIWCGRHESL